MSADQIRAYLFDVAGLGFAAAAIYVGVTHGVGSPEFSVFATLAGAYLGLKAPTVPPATPPAATHP